MAARPGKDVCREHEIAETLSCSWREKLLEGVREQLTGREERQGERELRQARPRARAGARLRDFRARARLDGVERYGPNSGLPADRGAGGDVAGGESA